MADAPAIDDVVGHMLFGRLFDEAERVRWSLADLPWSRLDRAAATPALQALVRDVAFSELTTYSATRRFLADFADDADLTQWIAVWFYEETKHPTALLRWLHEVGVVVDDGFVRRGRATAPFMRSRMGTLVTNVVSEMVAAAGYADLERTCGEPVLARIARNLSADEARHAASFYAYARRHLERSRDPDRERRDALKVLYMWFQDNEAVRHPVNEFYGRAPAGPPDDGGLGATRDLGRIAPRDRIFRLLGTLLDLPIDPAAGAAGLLVHIERLGARAPSPPSQGAMT